MADAGSVEMLRALKNKASTVNRYAEFERELNRNFRPASPALPFRADLGGGFVS